MKLMKYLTLEFPKDLNSSKSKEKFLDNKLFYTRVIFFLGFTPLFKNLLFNPENINLKLLIGVPAVCLIAMKLSDKILKKYDEIENEAGMEVKIQNGSITEESCPVVKQVAE